MTTRDDQHEIISFDDYLERQCDTASIEWVRDQLRANGLDAAPVLQNVQRIIAGRETKRAVSPWRKPLRWLARVAAVILAVPGLFAIGVDHRSDRRLEGLRAPMPASVQGHENYPLDLFKEEFYRTRVPYGAIIYREARKNDLPPELVAAMVHTESDFRPGLVSHKSAQGLMQIVPSAAALLGVDDPFDPEKNIAAGTRYYRYLLERFGDETIALAAYNAGEGNVARFGGIPPFQETRDYIAKVNRRTLRYRNGLRNSYIASVRLRKEADAALLTPTAARSSE